MAMTPALATRYIGLMSGTSLDGVDGVLAEMVPGRLPVILAEASVAMPAQLRASLLALNSSGADELHRAALAARELTTLYAQVVTALLARGASEAAHIVAIGAHGQTVRHRPDLGYTVQLNAPALLAELTGIAVVADFRSRDIAAGGQGAPLTPAFHAAQFAAAEPVAVLNLGGIANLTLLRPGQSPSGFDTGPANVLLDLWCARHTGCAYDADGRWAASGRVIPALLAGLLRDEPWLQMLPPKSTGRDLFNAHWLDAHLARYGSERLAPQDVQATLQRYTAQTVVDALQAHAPDVARVLVCGGGARNAALMRDLADVLASRELPCTLTPTDAVGVPAHCVEALAFAWLAWAHLNRVTAGLPTVTGSQGARVLGAYYPA